ncbi:MAG: hypothetical protein K8I65_13085 [Thermoanaerobaculia bacterium]|nr:hypothetical protein [Thermoanaerobaculia bacterium]
MYKNCICLVAIQGLWLLACGTPAPTADEMAETAPAKEAASPPVQASTPAQVEEPEVPSSYEVSIDPEILPNGNVRLALGTNIPGVIEVMAGLSLHGQADDDVWVGKNERVRLANGTGTVTFSTADLPSGRYDAEINFYPRWGFQDASSRASRVSEPLSASTTIALKGSGASAAANQFEENGQKWVMEHVAMGDPWRPNDWIQRFGRYEEMRVDQGNPEILKAYYFSRIDTTLIVNELKGEISIWRLGRAGH